ncbi:uncharacterized protein LY89DRAFT_761711 [Mollisia scopiformis]|uniref:Uncharacterized protein n=1 Tax=Mollisia scopiformis TaxID=149040 RepID=A0A132BB53_MOLSC|nr:uncharacterized protein LY89DRAFT_761711 [Mollisia scopiformis]KUJ09229.1 hypothetical protein LY89DRAFT_761711 [Mollisia scopiformis]
MNISIDSLDDFAASSGAPTPTRSRAPSPLRTWGELNSSPRCRALDMPTSQRDAPKETGNTIEVLTRIDSRRSTNRLAARGQEELPIHSTSQTSERFSKAGVGVMSSTGTQTGDTSKSGDNHVDAIEGDEARPKRGRGVERGLVKDSATRKSAHGTVHAGNGRTLGR